MPELPEVETCRRIIAADLTGHTVTAVTVRLEKLLRFSPIPSLEGLIGKQVVGARRRAKVLIADFSDDLSLVIHLKLAGQIAVHLPDGSRHMAGHPVPKPDGPYPHKTTHVDVGFDDGRVLYISDVRQFGWLRLMPTSDVDAFLATLDLGPEATGSDGMTAAELRARLARRSIAIKTALLDQAVIAGVGNIYVDEALHRARIHPETPARDLKPAQVATLWDAVVWAMEEGIAQGGAKIIHSKAYPVNGFPAVHAREGEPCLTCGAPIVKTRVGQRGTYLCPTCQKKPRARSGVKTASRARATKTPVS